MKGGEPDPSIVDLTWDRRLAHIDSALPRLH
jgi:hypothetical protein